MAMTFPEGCPRHGAVVAQDIAPARRSGLQAPSASSRTASGVDWRSVATEIDVAHDDHIPRIFCAKIRQVDLVAMDDVDALDAEVVAVVPIAAGVEVDGLGAVLLDGIEHPHAVGMGELGERLQRDALEIRDRVGRGDDIRPGIDERLAIGRCSSPW